MSESKEEKIEIKEEKKLGETKPIRHPDFKDKDLMETPVKGTYLF